VPYSIVDSNGGTDTGVMTVAIIDGNPVAEVDTNVTNVGEPVTGNVLPNDSDPNPADSVTIVDTGTGAAATSPITITTSNGGTVVMNPDGSYQYTAAPGFAGVDTFDYEIVDTFGKTDSASVSITVRGTGQWAVSGPETIDEGSAAQFAVSLGGIYGIGEQITVDLGIANDGTNNDDYSDFVAAVEAAVASNPDVIFEPTTGTLIYTSPADGAAMGELIIELPILDDGLIEGPEDFTISVDNAGSSLGGNVSVDPVGMSHRTTINDAQGPGIWSVSGPDNSDEGSTPEFTISLTGDYSAGEVVSVDLGMSDNGTNSSDYADFIAAVTAAANANPDVSFNPDTGTLTYTAPTDGATMSDIVIGLQLFDDDLIEGPEDFTLELGNASSPTGASVAIDTTSGAITSTINDTQGSGPGGTGGLSERPGEWSLSGELIVDEGAIAPYTVSLGGTYGAGEVVSVQISINDIATNSEDYESFISAVQLAAASNPDVTFEPSVSNQSLVTRLIDRLILNDAANDSIGTLTYTAPFDGASMEDLQIGLPIINDSLVEDQESYSIELSNASSITGALVGIGNDNVMTSIKNNDYAPSIEPQIGAAERLIPDYVPSTYEPVDILENAYLSDDYQTLIDVSDNVLLRTLALKRICSPTH